MTFKWYSQMQVEWRAELLTLFRQGAHAHARTHTQVYKLEKYNSKLK